MIEEGELIWHTFRGARQGMQKLRCSFAPSPGSWGAMGLHQWGLKKRDIMGVSTGPAEEIESRGIWWGVCFLGNTSPSSNRNPVSKGIPRVKVQACERH